jgi:hypothetical protein
MSKNIFPAVITQKTSGGFEAVLGLSLKSILKKDLFLEVKSMEEEDDNSSTSTNQKVESIYREGLLQAISTWPKIITLEMHITSLPNLKFKAQGRILMSMILRTKAKTELKARKYALEKFLSLRTLLLSHMSDAEFTPITNKSELKFHLAPFPMKHAMAVHRETQRIQITQGVERRTVKGLLPHDDSISLTATKGHFIDYVYPWRESIDDWSRLFQIMMYDLDPLKIIIKLSPAKLSGAQHQTMENDIQNCELVLNSNKPYEVSLQRQAALVHRSLLNKIMDLNKGALNVGVFIMASHKIDSALCNITGQTISRSRSISEKDPTYNGGFAISEINVKQALNSGYFPEKSVYSVSEAACAFRLPSPPTHEIHGLPLRRSRTCLAPLPDLDQSKDGVNLCLNIHSGLSQPVFLPANDRMRHHFIIGQTGTGKSTMMESMIMQDILAGHGVAVIDPHGEMVDNILGKIPESRLDDVILFDVLDRERPLGFNLLQYRTIEERDFIIDELYDSIDKIYDLKKTGGPMFESYMRGMLKLLMGSKPSIDFKPTLLEFKNCFISKEFRNWLFYRTDEEDTKDFVREVIEVQGEASLQNMSPYVTAKISRFVSDSTLSNIIGQQETSFDFEEIMQDGKIFLAKLGKGRFGSTVSALLANQLVGRFKKAAMKRGEMTPSERRDFYLYVDECHNLPMSTFTQLLAEARKYRLGLVLATQYAKQLQGEGPNDDLLAAILGNVGCLSIFRLGIDDAKLLAPSLYPFFGAIDIIGLPNWQGYCKLTIGKDSITPFSFESIMDQTTYNKKVARKVCDLSRQIYGCDVKTIKNQIESRRNMWKNADE